MLQQFTCQPLFRHMKAPKSPQNDLGEGPCWDHRTNTLYWVDIKGQEVCSYHAPSNATTRRFVGSDVGFAVLTHDPNRLIIGTSVGVGFYHLGTGEVTYVHRPEKHLPQNRFNDGKVSPCGRLFAGTMRNYHPRGTEGSLYLFEKALAVCKRVDTVGKVGVSNGLGWSPDGRVMYFIDSPTKCIVAYTYDPDTGTLANGRTFVDASPFPGAPDGMATDEQGDLWVAFYRGGAVRKFSGSTGDYLAIVSVPVACVTSVCFGGPSLDLLFITTAVVGQEATQHSGMIFVARVGVKGTKATLFDVHRASSL
jgi:sugar lactone lactonase YvrE